MGTRVLIEVILLVASFVLFTLAALGVAEAPRFRLGWAWWRSSSPH